MLDPAPNESALALLIQEGRAAEPAIAALLVRQYAPGVHRLTRALLNGRPDAEQTARQITRRTFASALANPEHFTGAENVRAWLYAQAIQHARHSSPSPFHPPPELAPLSPHETLPLILRYGHGLSLADLARILHTSERNVHQRLTRARQVLLAHQPPGETPRPGPAHHPRKITLLLDGLLPPSAEAELSDHLAICPACQAHLQRLRTLEQFLAQLLGKETPLPPEETSAILHAIQTYGETLPLRPKTARLQFRLKEAIWVILAAGIFLALARWLNPFFLSPPPNDTPPPPTPTLPPAQQIPTLFRQPNPDALVASAPEAHTAWILWDFRAGEHTPTTAVVISESEDAVAFGEENSVIYWQLQPGRSQQKLQGHDHAVTALAFNSAGTMLASGDEDGQVIVWMPKRFRSRFQLNDHPGPVRALAFSSNSQYLAVALDSGFWLWEFQEGVAIRILAARWKEIRELAFSPDGQWLAAADQDNAIALWSVPQGELLLRYETLHGQRANASGVITRLSFSPDGERLASASFDGKVEVVRLSPTPDGRVQGARLFVLQHPSWVSDLRWTPDGQLLAAVAGSGLMQTPDGADRAVYLWDAEDGTLAAAPLTGRTAHGLSRIQFLADGEGLIASNFKGNLFFWALLQEDEMASQHTETALFRRAASDLIEANLPENPPAGLITDTARLSEMAGFAPLLPENLSNEYALEGGVFEPQTQTLRLIFEHPRLASSQLVLSQTPLNAVDWMAFFHSIGAGAMAYRIPLNETMGELVFGSWVLTNPDNPDFDAARPARFRWSHTGMVSLRWVQENFLMELKTPFFQLDEQGNETSPVDLFELAKNLVALSTQPLLVRYTVEFGDTCIAIASRFGTSVEQITAANGLDNCELILTGQPLLVPLPNSRPLLYEADLNCDAVPERIYGIPDPNIVQANAYFGVILHALPAGFTPETGTYSPVWQATIADMPVNYFGPVELLSAPACERLLMLSQITSPNANASGLHIYRWNGREMIPVLITSGLLVESTTPNDPAQPFQLTTLQVIYHAETITCSHVLTTYRWDGTQFIEAAQETLEGQNCFANQP